MKRILRRSAFAALVITLAFPTAALAARAEHHSPKPNPTVMFVLRGNITGYTAASGTTAGSVTIAVSKANFHRAGLDNTTVTLATSSKTKVVRMGSTDVGLPGSFSDKGVVKVRAPWDSTSSTISVNTSAFQIIDQGPASK
jgi:hypothetical protein